MKKLLISMLAVATLASCAKEETLSFDKGEAIQFGNAFVDNATRATDPSYNTTTKPLTSFKVYGAVEGVNIFDGDTVEKGSAAYGAAWTIQDAPTQYWIEGANYTFDAVVDATSVTTDDEATGLPTSLKYNTNTQKDMLHNRVTTVGKPTANDGLVAFTFTHLLSKVKFTVTNNTASTATRYRYTVSEIKITNANLVGDYAIPGGTWSGVTTGEYSIPDMTIASNSTVDCEAEVLLIPGSTVGMTFNVNVQMLDEATWKTIKTYPKTYTDVKALVANNAYNFKVTVGLDDDIQFTATQSPTWDGNDTTSGIQNGYNDTTLTL